MPILKDYDKTKQYYKAKRHAIGERGGLVQPHKHFDDNKFIWRTKPNKTGKHIDIDDVIDMMVDYEYDTICDNLYSISYNDLHNISPKDMKLLFKLLIGPAIMNILVTVFAIGIHYRFKFRRWCAFTYEAKDVDPKERII